VYRDRLPDNRHEQARRVFEDRVAAIFQHLPALSGFYVRPDLTVAELSVHSWPGSDRSVAVAEELGRILGDLVLERPEAAERLRGRTFARSFQ
jgi:hypothetical protein